MKRKMIETMAVLLMLVTAGCGQAQQETTAAAAVTADNQEVTEASSEQKPTGQGSTPEKVSLVVGNTAGSIKPALVVLAAELGYYEEEGLDVTFENISSLNDGLTAIELGKMDVLPLGAIPSITFISQGSEHVIFGGTISEGGQAVVTEENRETITSIEDFRGKTVACVRPETGHMYAKYLCAQAGMTLGEDVNFVELDGFQSVIEAVSKGSADVGFVNSGFGQVAETQGLVVAFNIGDVYPDAVCCRQTTSQTIIREKRDALVRFEIANLRAWQLYQTDKETAIQTLMEFSGQSREYVEYCLYAEVMKISMDPARNRVQEFYEVMLANGDIPEGSAWNVDTAVDTSIYEEALAELILRCPEDASLIELQEKFQENNG